MPRLFLAILVSAVSLFAANFRLYMQDGSFQLVREYKVDGDRVRYYTVERSDWEEIPLRIVDLKRTEDERQVRDEKIKKDAAELAAEEKFEREQRDERERVPQEPGVYLLDGKELKTVKQAESKTVTNKGRSVLKVFSPLPIVAGKATVELDGEHSATLVPTSRPEFYIRLSDDERLSIVRVRPKKNSRVVQRWTIIPVAKEMVEEQDDVEIFRKQVDGALLKIWPTAPLEPGEYAVIQYTAGKGNIRVWDFASAGK